MLEIKLNVEVTAKDLSEAITQLAHSLSKTVTISDQGISIPIAEAEVVQGHLPGASGIAENAPAAIANAQPEIMNTPEPSPIQPNFPTVPEPIQQAVPEPIQQAVPEPIRQAEPEPVQPPKAIDLDMISRAGAALIDQGKMNDILALLKKHGVMAVNKLDPSQFPAFADDLRALGADI